ncbi:hypothetical protein IFM89_017859 [Coptis chinensis]|uniref:Uncharacterized protein n=1 Tax=Coptis chinensis TaxID=261450 RepID=A0A835HZ93_9MAGN|nr:hypothetical protein IFM89_017859 [Coptis chinensis]
MAQVWVPNILPKLNGSNYSIELATKSLCESPLELELKLKCLFLLPQQLPPPLNRSPPNQPPPTTNHSDFTTTENPITLMKSTSPLIHLVFITTDTLVDGKAISLDLLHHHKPEPN